MRRFFVGLLAVIGAVAIVVFLLFALVVFTFAGRKGAVPAKTILEADLQGGLVEDVPDDPVAKAMTSGQAVVRDIVDAIDRGANDSRVTGLVARIGGEGMGAAQVQEIRDAVIRFRAKKKFAIAWAETIGEFSPASGGYHLATGFDQIWLQPSGDLGLTGVIAESYFVRGTLDKLGIVPRMDHRYEYKNAMNMLTERKFTPPHREATERLITSIWDQRVRAIAEARKLTPEQVRAAVDRGPFLGKEAVDAKLVDGLAYRDEVYAKAKQRGGQSAELLYLGKYLERAGRPHEHGKTIALIYAVGAVQRGKSGYDPVFGSMSMGSDTVAGAFRDAINNNDVKAIVLRIDSPGGSYVASDTIWREVVRARQKGKPVIASMGDVAASGGYFVAMAADRIIAQPGTITGSIGVLGGKMVTTGAWNKIGVTWDTVHQGRHATMWSGLQDYTPSEWQRFEDSLDRIYADFTGKVAEGRRLPKERVLQIAKGRVWTGEDAKSIGLVDELGGFPAAVAAAKRAAKIPEREDVRIQVFPMKKTLWQVLMDRLSGDERESSEKPALVRVLQTVQPVLRQMRVRGVLEMPEVSVK